jgi:hypothetical protein
MKNKWLAFFAVGSVLAFTPDRAVQSRMTEYHKTGLKISKNLTFNIKFPNGFFVSGTVKSPTGAAVKEAILFVGDAADEYSGYLGSTDSAGKFSIPVQAGTKYLTISPPSSDSVDPSRFPRLIEKRIDGIKVTKDTGVGPIKLKNGYILSGKISPPAGSGTLKTFAPLIEVFPSNSLEVISIAQTGGANSKVDTNYAVALPAGRYRIWAIANGTTVANQIVQMQPTIQPVKVQKDTAKNIVMAKGGYSLSGTVKDAAGSKLDGLLFVIPKSGSFKGGALMLCGVSKGVFGYDTDLNLKNVFIPSGSYTLMFVPLSYLSLDYKGKATVSYYDLAMPAAGKTLALIARNGFVVSGKTVDASNRTVQALLSASNKKAQLSLNLLGLNLMLALSDSKGNYRFALPADTFNLQALPLSSSSAVAREKILRRLIGTSLLR